MLSIYHDFYSTIEGQKKYSNSIIPKDNKNYFHTLNAARLLLTAAKETCEAILAGKLRPFDPLVGEKACHSRALHITLITDQVFQKNAQVYRELIEKKLSDLKRYYNAPPKLPHNLSSQEIIKRLNLDIDVSPEMLFMQRAFLLTYAKHFRLEDTKVFFKIDLSKLQNLSKYLDRSILEKIVHVAREQIAMQTVQFIQQEAEKLSVNALPEAENIRSQIPSRAIKTIYVPHERHFKGINPDHVDENELGKIGYEYFKFGSLSAYYSVKTVLLKLCEEKIPILLKEYRTDEQKKMLLLYELDPNLKPKIMKHKPPINQPIYVFEVLFNKKLTQQDLELSLDNHGGIIQMLLQNAAVIPQYNQEDDFSLLDKEANIEIEQQREKGKKLGFNTFNPSHFSVAHAYASTTHEECLHQQQQYVGEQS